MKKVLIVGYFTPYRKGGSGRMLGLVKYLPKFGWEPIVLTGALETAPEKNFRVIATPPIGDTYTPIRKFLSLFGFETKEGVTQQIKSRVGIQSRKSIVESLRTLYQEIFGYPDTERGWKEPAIKEAKNLLGKEKIDAVISVWPITSHLVAKEIKERYKIPWIADFPDPWSENHDYPYGKLRKFFDRRLEIKTISSADALTAASPSYAKKEEAVHKRNVKAITLGFDPETISKISAPVSKKFTITYTGTIYLDKQDPSKILAALSNLVNERRIDGRDIEARFYGAKYDWLESEIEKYGVSDIVKQYGAISKPESLKKQAESQILLLLGWEDFKEEGVYPLKTFEYLVAKRPILVTGGAPNEEIKKIIADVGAGKSAITIEEVKETIYKMYSEYKKVGMVKYTGTESKIKKYSYETMAEKFAEILNQISK